MNEKAGWKPAGHRSTAPRAGHRGAFLQAFPKLLGGRCWVEIPLSLTTLGAQMSANAAGKMFIFTKDVTCIANRAQKRFRFPLHVEKAFLCWVQREEYREVKQAGLGGHVKGLLSRAIWSSQSHVPIFRLSPKGGGSQPPTSCDHCAGSAAEG